MGKYTGQLEGFPEWVVSIMLDRQEEQGNKRDVSVFEEKNYSPKKYGGFDWTQTPEGGIWDKVTDGNFQPLADFYKVDVKTGKPLDGHVWGLFSRDEDEPVCKWVKTVLLFDQGEKVMHGRYIVVLEQYTSEYLSGQEYNWTYYDFMKPLDPEPTKLTRKQIAEKFNIDENFELINE